jgi:hypothetical protein
MYVSEKFALTENEISRNSLLKAMKSTEIAYVLTYLVHAELSNLMKT